MSSQLSTDLRRFLQPLRKGAAERAVRLHLRRRERMFFWLMRRAVYAQLRSPYRALLEHAGISLPDLKRRVADEGLDATLAHLYAAGVYVTPEEFKGRRPIRRPGLELPVDARDFDNPLAVAHFEAHTSGSRGEAMPVSIDLRLLAPETAHLHYFLEGFGLRDRPVALWRGVPPVASGVLRLLRYAKLGLPVERWFAQNTLPEGPDTLAPIRFTRDLLDASRRIGQPLPEPEYVHQTDAVEIARWLADKRDAGTPAQLDTNTSSAVRVCLAALDNGVDISGSFFRVGGEPYTPAKAAIIRETDCQCATFYSTTEASNIGSACSAPEYLDEVHLLTDKFAFLQQKTPDSRALGVADAEFGALFITTLLPASSKIMLNVDSGDSGYVRRRACGCPLDQVGFDLHLWDLRSHERITSEALNYLRCDLVPLIEQVLPETFGGTVGDYQLVESEARGMPIVEIVVSPRIGPVEDAAVLGTVYAWLRSRTGGQIMTDFWQDADTVRVVRRAPYATSSAKVLPLRRFASS